MNYYLFFIHADLIDLPFQQVKPSLQRLHLSFTTMPAGGAVPPLGFPPTANPNLANGCRYLSTLTRLAGQAGSSLPAATTLTTAEAPVHSHWGGIWGQPTTPLCAPSCTHLSSPPTRCLPPVVFLTGFSQSVYCTSTMRRTWCWSSTMIWWRSAAAAIDWPCSFCTLKHLDLLEWAEMLYFLAYNLNYYIFFLKWITIP